MGAASFNVLSEQPARSAFAWLSLADQTLAACHSAKYGGTQRALEIDDGVVVAGFERLA